MARRKKRSEAQERERLAYFSAKHPADLIERDLIEFEELKAKYGSI